MRYWSFCCKATSLDELRVQDDDFTAALLSALDSGSWAPGLLPGEAELEGPFYSIQDRDMKYLDFYAELLREEARGSSDRRTVPRLLAGSWNYAGYWRRVQKRRLPDRTMRRLDLGQDLSAADDAFTEGLLAALQDGTSIPELPAPASLGPLVDNFLCKVIPHAPTATVCRLVGPQFERLVRAGSGPRDLYLETMMALGMAEPYHKRARNYAFLEALKNTVELVEALPVVENATVDAFRALDDRLTAAVLTSLEAGEEPGKECTELIGKIWTRMDLMLIDQVYDSRERHADPFLFVDLSLRCGQLERRFSSSPQLLDFLFGQRKGGAGCLNIARLKSENTQRLFMLHAIDALLGCRFFRPSVCDAFLAAEAERGQWVSKEVVSKRVCKKASYVAEIEALDDSITRLLLDTIDACGDGAQIPQEAFERFLQFPKIKSKAFYKKIIFTPASQRRRAALHLKVCTEPLEGDVSKRIDVFNQSRICLVAGSTYAQLLKRQQKQEDDNEFLAIFADQMAEMTDIMPDEHTELPQPFSTFHEAMKVEGGKFVDVDKFKFYLCQSGHIQNEPLVRNERMWSRVTSCFLCKRGLLTVESQQAVDENAWFSAPANSNLNEGEDEEEEDERPANERYYSDYVHRFTIKLAKKEAQRRLQYRQVELAWSRLPGFSLLFNAQTAWK